jgi:hypothetical protein
VRGSAPAKTAHAMSASRIRRAASNRYSVRSPLAKARQSLDAIGWSVVLRSSITTNAFLSGLKSELDVEWLDSATTRTVGGDTANTARLIITISMKSFTEASLAAFAPSGAQHSIER